MKRGFYIIFEGGEGCGKSTQAKLLKEFFDKNKIPCILSREPGGIKESEQIRNILLKKENKLHPITELFLYEAARTEFFNQKVIPSLKKGVTVIIDRSGYSTEAYQGYAGKVNLNLIKKLNEIATFGSSPFLVFLIDIETKKGLEKEKEKDRFAEKGIKYHEKVREGYLKIAKENKNKFIVIKYKEDKIQKMQLEIRKHLKQRMNI